MEFGIIAAGKGSRLNSEGSGMPKPLTLIGGETFLHRLVRIFCDCGAQDVNIILNETCHRFEDTIKEECATLPCGLHLKFADTPSSLHSFYELCEKMKPAGKFIITTADTIFFEKNFHKFVDYYRFAKENEEGLMGVTRYVDDEKPLYVSIDTAGLITGFADTPGSGKDFVSAGVYGLTPKALPVLKRCVDNGVERMRNFQRELLRAGIALEAFDMGKVIDVDRPEDLEQARKFIGEKKA